VQKPHCRPWFSQNACWTGCSFSHEGARPSTVRTEEPSAVVRDLLAVHREVPALSVTRPGLEDVYLQLVEGATR